ncbi:hypothetical protein AB376_00850 [Listeria monocytogenes]|uniref:hypothetical protein n=1 Tax=Listeria monocytogenes TaxID=1639 RepID=UPI0010B79003|nr:hypothetical protein [Listeria monocytogenes]EAC6871556.1 hypothetical protein [Listeria monocytogenes]EAD1931670.1 hypothetical protein [Listeria monocytogenes]EAF5832058.1 hypothetical protein [Listeria monocytogenes]
MKKTTKKVQKTVTKFKKAAKKSIKQARKTVKKVYKKAKQTIVKKVNKIKKTTKKVVKTVKKALCKNQEFLESQKKGYSDPTYDYKDGYPRPGEAWTFDANGNIDKEKSAEVA